VSSLAAGHSPLGAFNELINMQNRREVDLASVWYAGLDEWVGLGSDETGSCAKVMREAYYAPAKIPSERIRVFDGLAGDLAQQCEDMDKWITFHGGIGYTLLGVGLNGHVGFNEPRAPETKGCLTVPLDSVTLAVSGKYFKQNDKIAYGVTIGKQTLFEARTVVIIANGAKKAAIMKAALQGPITPGVPASIFQKHNDMTAILDKEAASLLD
jgi:glucosamine-6-phosphate isomerase